MNKEIEKKLIEGNLNFKWKIMQDLESIPTKETIPKYPVLIFTCMDPRIDVLRIFQLNPGDVFIFRNAGNVYTNDTLRSVLVTIVKYNISYIIVLGHLDCGMTKINLKEFRAKLPSEFLSQLSKNYSVVLSELNNFFKPFQNELENVRKQIKTLDIIKSLYPDIEITGMLYDIKTGLIFEYNLFRDYKTFENFKEIYKEMIIKKKEQFADYLINIKAKDISPDEPEVVSHEIELGSTKLTNTKQINKLEENSPIYEHGEPEEFKMKSIMQKISIPKIQFHKVKIYIPTIIKKRKSR
ncbi:MAG: carbonic anhydrase [Candidatus Thorarchaeota archaeon]